MRASRETELVETFPSHVVAAWLGHSVAIAEKHYLQVTEDHFVRAAEAAGTEAVQNPVQPLPEPARIVEKPKIASSCNLPLFRSLRENAR